MLAQTGCWRGELVLTGCGRTIPTFAEAAEKVIAIHATGWKDGSLSERDWRATLRSYAMPRLGGMPRSASYGSTVLEGRRFEAIPGVPWGTGIAPAEFRG